MEIGDEVDVGGLGIDTIEPVLVTGATGYVASWIVSALLKAGVAVHAAVRDPNNAAKVRHLQRSAKTPDQLKLFQADLLQDGSYTEAMQGCGIVFHTASPFQRNVKDAQRDLVDPAVMGTRNVLESANSVQSVHRVVLTSSIAAVYTDAIETEKAPGGILNENTWNTTASLAYEPYNYSKTLAEHEAWRIADAQDRWRLVAINPALVIGPALNPHPTSESFTIMKMLGNGDLKFGSPTLGVALVDVREVARAELAAAYLPHAEGRHIISAGDSDMLHMGELLRPEFGDHYPLPHRKIPTPLFWLVAPATGFSRRYVSGNVGHRPRLDNTKSREKLGMKYRPIRDSLSEMFAQMAETGAFA